ncbi:YihY/virulence factor BrkB family protein [Sedimenticola sp.]|uniref:YihY/virulence factor BrkB family protein n=1 Tax=Sedimenticola sp. TaxID=1940285 RepID=UPI003D0AF423
MLIRALRKLEERIAQAAPRFRSRTLRRSARVVVDVVHGLWHGELNLYATSLAFTTLLAIVPMLALGFAMFRKLDLHQQLREVLHLYLVPLGEQGLSIETQVYRFISDLDVGVLGTVGIVVLAYSLLSLVQKTEHAFNFIWSLPSNRSLLRGVGIYLAIMICGPLFGVLAVASIAALADTQVAAAFQGLPLVGGILVEAWTVWPYLLVMLGFALLYRILPNTRVSLRAALIGGLVGSGVWVSIGLAFADFVTGSGRYQAIYSGLAIPFFFMLWLFFSWLSLLIGAQIAASVDRHSIAPEGTPTA